MDELEKLTVDLEYQYLKYVMNTVRDKTLSVPDAKKSAQGFLKLLPFNSVDDVKNKISSYTPEFPFFTFLHKYMSAYDEEQKTAQVIEKMKQHIKNNNIDDALKVAQNT